MMTEKATGGVKGTVPIGVQSTRRSTRSPSSTLLDVSDIEPLIATR